MFRSSARDTDTRLAQLRGTLPLKRAQARDVAADLDQPGCALRGLLDAAGLDKAALATRLDHPMPEEQSPMALRRGNLFERIVFDNGMAHVLAQLRRQLELPIIEARMKDLSRSSAGLTGEAELRARATETRTALKLIADPDAAFNVLQHPVTTLERNGRLVYLEQDALGFKVGDKLHVVEIKSFPVINGVPPEQSAIAQAARQSAVYVLSLQHTLREAGLDPELISPKVILITPRGYDLTPTSNTLDVRIEIKALRRRLATRTPIETVLAGLPENFTFDLADPHALRQAVEAVPFRYVPACMSSCSMARLCRERCTAGDVPDHLGQVVSNDLGGIQTLTDAVRAARTGHAPHPDDAEVAAALAAAHTAYLAAGGAA